MFAGFDRAATGCPVRGPREPVPEAFFSTLLNAEAGLSVDGEPPPKKFDNLSDPLLNSPFAGANLDLERPRDYPRDVDFG